MPDITVFVPSSFTTKAFVLLNEVAALRLYPDPFNQIFFSFSYGPLTVSYLRNTALTT